jgi:hypothetical protein
MAEAYTRIYPNIGVDEMVKMVIGMFDKYDNNSQSILQDVLNYLLKLKFSHTLLKRGSPVKNQIKKILTYPGIYSIGETGRS